jgi:hypothetical protein
LVVRLAPIFFILVALFVSCKKAPHNNAAIRQGVIEHLNKGSGLNLSLVDIEITHVTYQGDDKAIATVFFRPKSSPEQGMTMPYTLEAKGNKWTVVKKPGMAGGGGSDNPHSGVGAGAPSPHGAETPSGQLPPGHPPVSGDKSATPSPAPTGPAK